jgi:hypothetical protein
VKAPFVPGPGTSRSRRAAPPALPPPPPPTGSARRSDRPARPSPAGRSPCGGARPASPTVPGRGLRVRRTRRPSSTATRRSNSSISRSRSRDRPSAGYPALMTFDEARIARVRDREDWGESDAFEIAVKGLFSAGLVRRQGDLPVRPVRPDRVSEHPRIAGAEDPFKLSRANCRRPRLICRHRQENVPSRPNLSSASNFDPEDHSPPARDVAGLPMADAPKSR